MSKIRVLVVDDSAVVRGVLSRAINAQPDMEVIAVAADPVLAMERIRLSPPDVITLDVEMPRMSGLEFLRQLMGVRPIPVVMVSSLTERGADITLQALALGAIDFIAKPAVLGADGLEAYAEQIADKVRAAALSKPVRRAMSAASSSVPSQAPLVSAAENTSRRSLVRVGTRVRDLIVIGASTGGVEALSEVLETLPVDTPPILIAQHMPAGFTRTFARRLDALCAVGVKEAEEGDLLKPGHAYLAPGGRHLLVTRRDGGLIARVTDDPPVNRHRPSVEVLFRSSAQLRASACIGVMLSGMGADGALAMADLRAAGSYNLAQDESTCVVFGMPKQAIAAGAVHEVLALRDIAPRLVELSRK